MSLLLLVHVITALATITASVAALARFFTNSSTQRVRAYLHGALAATLTTGVGLVIVSPSALLHTCVAGLVLSVAALGVSRYTRTVAMDAR